MVRIITDSTSDFSPARAQELGIQVVPLQVHFGAECYRDGVDITNREFYEKLAASQELPTTSQVNPDQFAQVFQACVDAGDEAVGLFISSKLSGTCQSAMIARSMVDEERIFVVDSQTVTFALNLLVEEAVSMRDQGASAREIAARLEELSQRVRLLAVVDTLKYLKKGGRISATAAVVGGMLGINPIIGLGLKEKGVVECPAKARGKKAAFRWLTEEFRRVPPDPAYRVSFGHSDSPSALAECRAAFQDLVDLDRALVGDIGAVVGTHAGPGAAGIAYIAQADRR